MKKIFSLLLIFMIIFSLTACGKRRGSDKDDSALDKTAVGTGDAAAVNPDKITEPMAESAPNFDQPPIYTYEKITDPFEVIKKYDSYSNMGFCCNHVAEDVSTVEGVITESQRGCMASLVRSTCCKTIDEAKAHAKYYMDASLVNDLYDDFFIEHNGSLYIVIGAQGHTSHNYKEALRRDTEDGKILFTTDLLGSGDNYCGKDQFTLKEIDGRLVIMSVESVE